MVTLKNPIQKALTRGYKNNNPGNIRKSNQSWLGKVEGDDPEFEKFKSMDYGYRALFILLRTYINNGYNTIEKIIEKYAPSNENDTQSYIRSVERQTGLARGEYISFSNTQEIKNLVAAISYHENGITPDLAQIDKGYNLLYA